jgi:hypothetical protein
MTPAASKQVAPHTVDELVIRLLVDMVGEGYEVSPDRASTSEALPDKPFPMGNGCPAKKAGPAGHRQAGPKDLRAVTRKSRAQGGKSAATNALWRLDFAPGLTT